MILKIFKGVWFFSLLGLLALFFYVYASMPEVVLFSDDTEVVSMSRNNFFYLFVSVMAVVNVLVFMIDKLVNRSIQGFSAWFYGLVVTLNAFFFSTLLYLLALNGGDRYDFSRMGPAMFGTMILILLWLIGGAFYFILKKNPSNN
jgi:hypothetical protein